MYVAITRAKERLYLLRACSRLSWGRRQAAPISRFINEIPGELISNISGISKIGRSSLSEYGSSESEHELATIEDEIVNPETRISRVEVAGKDLVLKIGDMVKHAKFGNGKILRLNVEASKMIAEIFFIGIGKKTLDLNIAKIEKA
jgi:DNA helicase-2/ATP-dependent DNA helicase PcrA